MQIRHGIRTFLMGGVTTLMLGGMSGCERKERIVDVQTPIGDVKVDHNKSTGDVDVEVKREPRLITP